MRCQRSKFSLVFFDRNLHIICFCRLIMTQAEKEFVICDVANGENGDASLI